MNRKMTRFICFNAVIAALYAVMTLALPTFSYGAIQFRVSEALTILPCLYPPAAAGLTVGCIIGNLGSPFGLWDILLGSLITLVAGFFSGRIKNPFFAALPPILLNATFLPLLFMMSGSEVLYYITFYQLLISQSVVILGLGVPFYYVIKKPFNYIFHKEIKT